MADNMREIKNRIKSVKQTMQITKAMKLISGVKLKKARNQLEQSAPYFNLIKETLSSMIENSGTINHKCLDLFNLRTAHKRLIIVFSGDKGLVGGYNSNIIKHTEYIVKESPDHTLWVLGNVGRNYLSRHGFAVDTNFDYNVQNPTVYRARDIADKILQQYMLDEFDEVIMLYTRMVSSLSQEPVVVQLLPLEIESLNAAINKKSIETKLDAPANVKANYSLTDKFLYEPNPTAVFDHLMPKYLKGMIYGALVEAYTCEQSARMTAMDNATTNAEEMISKLNLYYNRARQANITQEISEIVGGAAALD